MKTDKLIIIVLIILLVNTVSNIFTSYSTNQPAITEEDIELKIKMHDLRQEIQILEKTNTELTSQIKTFNDAIQKNNATLNNSTRAYRDSLRAIINPR